LTLIKAHQELTER